MAGFLGPIEVREIEGDTTHWVLLEPCVYHLKTPDGLEWVEAPKGFHTDFGSIPRPLWPIFPPTGAYRRAYVIHDKLYVAPVIRIGEKEVRVCTRGDADAILKEAMGVLGANWVTRNLVYAGVRSGGWLPWKKYRGANLAQPPIQIESRKQDDQ